MNKKNLFIPLFIIMAMIQDSVLQGSWFWGERETDAQFVARMKQNESPAVTADDVAQFEYLNMINDREKELADAKARKAKYDEQDKKYKEGSTLQFILRAPFEKQVTNPFSDRGSYTATQKGLKIVQAREQKKLNQKSFTPIVETFPKPVSVASAYSYQSPISVASTGSEYFATDQQVHVEEPGATEQTNVHSYADDDVWAHFTDDIQSGAAQSSPVGESDSDEDDFWRFFEGYSRSNPQYDTNYGQEQDTQPVIDTKELERAYTLLGLSFGNASELQVKKAFRGLALQYHPDKNHASIAEEKFKALSNAYQLIKDSLGFN